MGTTSRHSIAARGRAEDDAALLRREAELRRRPRVLREPQRDRVARVLLQRPHELLERDVQQDLAARAALDHVPLEQPRVEVRQARASSAAHTRPKLMPSRLSRRTQRRPAQDDDASSTRRSACVTCSRRASVSLGTEALKRMSLGTEALKRSVCVCVGFLL